MRSLAYRTERSLIGFDGEVYERADYWVLRSPDQPEWYWGNLLVFKQPPGTWSRREWTDAFKREFADLDGVQHMSLAWDSPTGNRGLIEPFVEVGFTPFCCDVLVGTRIERPPQANEDVTIRVAQTDEDYEQVVALQSLTRPSDLTDEAYMPYLIQRIGGMRRWVAAGHGQVVGAFDGDQMVACLGIFVADGVARYQSVVTAETHRRQGIAGRLVADAGQMALEELGAKTLVITAEEGASAGRIYASCGLKWVEKQVGMLRRAPVRG